MSEKVSRETQRAAQAFEDYWALGPSRSIRALWRLYCERHENGESVPTTRYGTLGKWSSQHDWQSRIKQRIAEESARIREAMREQADRLRERLAVAIDTDINRYLRRLSNNRDEVMAVDARSLDQLVRLFYELAEQPLTGRQEVAINAGSGVALREVIEQVGEDADATELLGELAGRIACGGPDAGEPRT